ncbi:phosphopentomutase [Desulfogranum mediterraneum]|uniref:phosphopentomutase n=1 Tax=Desulfogranum mediterraneum TaxID=160661 RepID=UPI00048E27DB|nr:phosphopentomutase [Desulfogranum mediterraneum]
MKRTIILLLDSLGIGGAEDGAQFAGISRSKERFTDQGANTLGHIAGGCARGAAEDGRTGLLHLPNMNRLGLGHACLESSGSFPLGLDASVQAEAAYGYARELSTGKDTLSGHWELAGVPVLFEWGYFREQENSFPQELLAALVERARLPGYLGNCQASGTAILEELGAEHVASGKPIFYTSADSVFQIACHEEHFGLERLYQLAEIARELVDPYQIGRVIARPFIGTGSSNYQRTANRHDYAMAPPAPTLLDRMQAAGGEVVAVGKINDIFAGRGITRAVKATGLEGLFAASLAALRAATEPSIIFTNFVDFDADFGHRRDLAGYAAGLEYFDQRLPEMIELLAEDDLLILTADHGCDPSWPGTDHTREHIPVICYGHRIRPGPLGRRGTFADIGQSVAAHQGLAALDHGTSFMEQIFSP